MYKLIELFNKQGNSAFVQEKNVKDWTDRGWLTEKPGGPEVEAFEKRSAEFYAKKKLGEK